MIIDFSINSFIEKTIERVIELKNEMLIFIYFAQVAFAICPLI